MGEGLGKATVALLCDSLLHKTALSLTVSFECDVDKLLAAEGSGAAKVIRSRGSCYF